MSSGSYYLRDKHPGSIAIVWSPQAHKPCRHCIGVVIFPPVEIASRLQYQAAWASSDRANGVSLFVFVDIFILVCCEKQNLSPNVSEENIIMIIVATTFELKILVVFVHGHVWWEIVIKFHEGAKSRELGFDLVGNGEVGFSWNWFGMIIYIKEEKSTWFQVNVLGPGTLDWLTASKWI
jgi:hypothetical protein